jgi:hypothetical protein
MGRQHWPGFIPCGSAWKRFVRSPTSHTCSVGAWSFTLPCRLARRGLGRSLPRRLARLGFIRPASQNCSAGARSFALSRRLAWWELGQSPRLAYLLDEGLVVRPGFQTCSAGAHSFALPHRIAQRGLGRSPHRLAWWGLVIRPASQTCSMRT